MSVYLGPFVEFRFSTKAGLRKVDKSCPNPLCHEYGRSSGFSNFCSQCGAARIPLEFPTEFQDPDPWELQERIQQRMVPVAPAEWSRERKLHLWISNYSKSVVDRETHVECEDEFVLICSQEVMEEEARRFVESHKHDLRILAHAYRIEPTLRWGCIVRGD